MQLEAYDGYSRSILPAATKDGHSGNRTHLQDINVQYSNNLKYIFQSYYVMSFRGEVCPWLVDGNPGT
jgi:hypothetical protein